MEHFECKKRKRTKIKKVNELIDHEVEKLHDILDVCDEIQELNPEIERIKEEINERIFQLKMEIEGERNNIDFFNNNIILKKEEIDRLLRRLDTMK